jgi:hypothetical protein
VCGSSRASCPAHGMQTSAPKVQGQPRDRQRRAPREVRLLRDDAHRIKERGGDAQEGAPARRDAVLRRGGADQDGAGERDRASGQQRWREAPRRARRRRRAAIRRGPRLTSIAAVPASTCRSASFRRDVVQRKPEHAAEGDCGHVPRAGSGSRRTATTRPSAMLREREAPEREGLRRQLARAERMATKADAHSVTVTSAAPRAIQAETASRAVL